MTSRERLGYIRRGIADRLEADRPRSPRGPLLEGVLRLVANGVRRQLIGSLAISLGAHAAALGALVLGFELRAGGARVEREGPDRAGVVFVSLSSDAADEFGLAPDAPDLDRSDTQSAAAEPARAPQPQSVPPQPALSPARIAAARLRAAPRGPAPQPPRRPPARETTARAAPRPIALGSAAPAHTPESPAPPTGGSARGRGPGDASAGSADAFANGWISTAARPATEIHPRYPQAARERGDEAEVVVEAWVAASGDVERVQVRSSAGREFDSAAVEAIRDARFHPASRDGEPVASIVAMRLHFELDP